MLQQKKPSLVLRMFFYRLSFSEEPGLAPGTCMPAVFFRSGQNIKKQMIRSEEAKVKAGKSARAGPGYRSQGWIGGLWRWKPSGGFGPNPSDPESLWVKGQQQHFPMSSDTVPRYEDTPHLRASGLQHASGASVAGGFKLRCALPLSCCVTPGAPAFPL